MALITEQILLISTTGNIQKKIVEDEHTDSRV